MGGTSVWFSETYCILYTAMRWCLKEVSDAEFDDRTHTWINMLRQWHIDMQIAISFVIRHSVTKKVVEVWMAGP